MGDLAILLVVHNVDIQWYRQHKISGGDSQPKVVSIFRLIILYSDVVK